MNRTYKTEGIVLKRVNLGEADRILTIYTKHYGKIRALAKGVRKLTSRKGGNVELFNHLVLFLVKGRDLDIISEVQLLNSFRSWRKDLNKIGLAYYFCELVDKLTPEGQADKAVFELLRESLGRIDKETPSELIRSLEEELLKELGFGILPQLQESQESLRDYIEEIIEKKISTLKIVP